MDGARGRGTEARGGGAAAARPPAWLVLAVLLHGLAYFLLLPPWMGEDEPWHLEHARGLALAHRATAEAPGEGGPARLTPSQERIRARTGAAPEDVARTQAEIVASMRRHLFWERVDFAGWDFGAEDLDHFVLGHTEAHQPPLYYAACALALRAAAPLGVRDVEEQLWLLRGLSLLCYLAVVACAWALARLASDEAWVPVAAALAVAWLPMHARQAALVSNDVLVKALSAGALLGSGALLVGRGGRRHVALLLALAGLALATKPTAIGIVPPLGVALAAAWGRGRGRGARVAAAALAAGVLALGALAYWKLAGSRALPDPAALRGHLEFVTSGRFWRELARTFVGAFNWTSRHLPGGAQAAVLGALGAGLLGSVVAAARAGSGPTRALVALSWVALVSQLLAMALRGFAAGRYLFPVLPALGLLVAVGWIAPLPPRWRGPGAVLLALLLVVYDGFALWSGLVPNLYLDLGS